MAEALVQLEDSPSVQLQDYALYHRLSWGSPI